MCALARCAFPRLAAPIGVALLATIALALGAASAVLAQQVATYPFAVTQNRVPGASGQAVITPLGNNQLRVDIRITGLPPTPNSRAAHIHTAAGAVCDNNAPVTYPLDSVAIDGSGNGTSSTTITLMPDKPVQASNAYVNVHEQASPPGQGVICANVTQSYAAQGGAAMPRTGTGGLLRSSAGTSNRLSAAILALAAALTGAGALSLARRAR